jgi:predicted nucleic acid-binding protein
MRLDRALAGVGYLCLDTAPVIYFIEANQAYDDRVTAIFQLITDGLIVGATSVVTLAEVLVHPLLQQNAALEQQYRDLLLNGDNLDLLPIDAAIAERAAQLRARHNLRTPDALQIAAALAAGCQAFLTNDRTLDRVDEIDVLVLDDLEL